MPCRPSGIDPPLHTVLVAKTYSHRAQGHWSEAHLGYDVCTTLTGTMNPAGARDKHGYSTAGPGCEH